MAESVLECVPLRCKVGQLLEGEGNSRAGPGQQGEDKGLMCKHWLPEWEWWARRQKKASHGLFLHQKPEAFVASQFGFHVSNLACEIKVKRKRGNALK